MPGRQYDGGGPRRVQILPVPSVGQKTDGAFTGITQGGDGIDPAIRVAVQFAADKPGQFSQCKPHPGAVPVYPAPVYPDWII